MSEINPQKNGISKKINDFNALETRDKWRSVGNWLLDHAMIIILLLMVIYIQIQCPSS